jgi:uncharacterized membrane protein YfcA
MQLLGFLSAILIGVTLGLMGGGGSILTVPILVYLLDVAPVSATAYSLFIVGLTSLIGSVTYMRKGLVDFKAAVFFSIPAFITVYLTRRFVIPAIPDMIFQINGWIMTNDILIMAAFSLLMISAAYSMIKKRKNHDEADDYHAEFNLPYMILIGITVGALSGFVGAGGGFLIIPALVIFAKLPMKTAIGTSLLIIAINSLIGFLGDLNVRTIECLFLFKFIIFTTAGIILGGYLSRFITGAKLKPAFGWFVLSMGFLILINEFIIGG